MRLQLNNSNKERILGTILCVLCLFWDLYLHPVATWFNESGTNYNVMQLGCEAEVENLINSDNDQQNMNSPEQ